MIVVGYFKRLFIVNVAPVPVDSSINTHFEPNFIGKKISFCSRAPFHIAYKNQLQKWINLLAAVHAVDILYGLYGREIPVELLCFAVFV